MPYFAGLIILKHVQFHHLSSPFQLFLHSLFQNIITSNSEHECQLLFNQLNPFDQSGLDLSSNISRSTSVKNPNKGAGKTNGDGKSAKSKGKSSNSSHSVQERMEDLSLIKDGISYFFVRYMLPFYKQKIDELKNAGTDESQSRKLHDMRSQQSIARTIAKEMQQIA
jgi:hypothetical protein